VLIPFPNAQLMEPTVQIEFGEHFAPFGSYNEVSGHRGWVVITQFLTIQLSIINTQAQFPILFGENNLGAIQTLNVTDYTCSLEDCDLSVQLWQMLWRHQIWPTSLWTCSFHFCDIRCGTKRCISRVSKTVGSYPPKIPMMTSCFVGKDDSTGLEPRFPQNRTSVRWVQLVLECPCPPGFPGSSGTSLATSPIMRTLGCLNSLFWKCLASFWRLLTPVCGDW